MDNKEKIMKFISPNMVPVIILILIPIIGTFFGLIILLTTTLPARSRAKKCVAALESKGELDYAAASLSAPCVKTLMKGKVVLSDRYVFCKGTGIALPYSEVQWAYKHRQTTTVFLIPVHVTESLYLATKTMKPKPVASKGKDKNEEIKTAILEIYNHNNNCLVGFNQQIAAEYKARIKK